jgi:hypothetical protein
MHAHIMQPVWLYHPMFKAHVISQYLHTFASSIASTQPSFDCSSVESYLMASFLPFQQWKFRLKYSIINAKSLA